MRQGRLDQRVDMMKKDIRLELRKLNEDLGEVERKVDRRPIPQLVALWQC